MPRGRAIGEALSSRTRTCGPCLADHSDAVLVPGRVFRGYSGVAKAVDAFRARGLKIGSTTCYTREMLTAHHPTKYSCSCNGVFGSAAFASTSCIMTPMISPVGVAWLVRNLTPATPLDCSPYVRSAFHGDRPQRKLSSHPQPTPPYLYLEHELWIGSAVIRAHSAIAREANSNKSNSFLATHQSRRQNGTSAAGKSLRRRSTIGSKSRSRA